MEIYRPDTEEPERYFKSCIDNIKEESIKHNSQTDEKREFIATFLDFSANISETSFKIIDDRTAQETTEIIYNVLSEFTQLYPEYLEFIQNYFI